MLFIFIFFPGFPFSGRACSCRLLLCMDDIFMLFCHKCVAINYKEFFLLLFDNEKQIILSRETAFMFEVLITLIFYGIDSDCVHSF